MHRNKGNFANRGHEVVKFYGHWPFRRLFGMQEPASAIFSAGNAIPHIYNFLNPRERFAPSGNFMTAWLRLYPLVSTVAWLASVAFHTRQTHFTIALDYCSALFLLGYALFVCVLRIAGPNCSVVRQSALWLLGFISLTGYILRASAIIAGRVSYGSHMQTCIALAAAHTLLWIGWAVCGVISTLGKPADPEGHPDRSTFLLCLFCQLWFSGAALMEIFDFPPIMGHFDAHSLWHAATIPLGFWWYSFWIMDNSRRLHSSKDKSI
jgi:hypothetical protein